MKCIGHDIHVIPSFEPGPEYQLAAASDTVHAIFPGKPAVAYLFDDRGIPVPSARGNEKLVRSKKRMKLD
jgi:hypothetical protein